MRTAREMGFAARRTEANPALAKTESPEQSASPLALSRIAAIIPAYNEAGRIEPVLCALCAAPEVSEIIVVSDGSTDDTCVVAARVTGVRVIPLPANTGKGGAMRAGALQTDADILIFFDADLIGLTPAHIHDLLEPVLSGAASMATGVFRGGRLATDLAQILVPAITGQRAIRRDVFLQIPDLEAVGYGIELAINYHVRRQKLPRRDVILRGVTHPMKEEKLGFLRGALSRARMYAQMLRFRLRH